MCVFLRWGLKQPLTGETPFQSPRRLSVRTTLKSSVTIPTRPDLKERQDRRCSEGLLLPSALQAPSHSLQTPSCPRRTLSPCRTPPSTEPRPGWGTPPPDWPLTRPRGAAESAGGSSAGRGAGKGAWSRCRWWSRRWRPSVRDASGGGGEAAG